MKKAYISAVKNKLWSAEEIQRESDECYNPSDDSAPRGYVKILSIPQKTFDSFGVYFRELSKACKVQNLDLLYVTGSSMDKEHLSLPPVYARFSDIITIFKR